MKIEINGQVIVDLKKRPLSYSSLSQFKRSPKHYLHYLSGKKKAAAVQVKGSVFDLMVLQPHEDPMKIYAVVPGDVDKRTKEGKAKWEDFVKANQGKQFISEADFDKARYMTDAVMANPAAKELLSRITRTQFELLWTHKDTGLPIKSLVDGMGEEIVMELKSASNAMPDKFIRDAISFGYPLQAGTYLRGIAATQFKFLPLYYLVCENEEPYGVSVLHTTDEYIRHGRLQLEKLLLEFKHCLTNNLWHMDYDFRGNQGVHTMDLPGWLKRQDED